MRYTIFSSVAYPDVLCFSTLSHKRHEFREKKLLNMKRLLSQTFLILRRIQHDIVINTKTSSCKVKVTLVRFYNQTWIFSTGFRRTLKYEISYKSVGDELFHADGQKWWSYQLHSAGLRTCLKMNPFIHADKRILNSLPYQNKTMQIIRNLIMLQQYNFYNVHRFVIKIPMLDFQAGEEGVLPSEYHIVTFITPWFFAWDYPASTEELKAPLKPWVITMITQYDQLDKCRNTSKQQCEVHTAPNKLTNVSENLRKILTFPISTYELPFRDKISTGNPSLVPLL